MNDVSTKWVYSFGADGTDGDTGMRNLLGGKGANLAEMSGIGLPVPPGFTITTEVCTHYYDNGRSYPDALASQVKEPSPVSRPRLGPGSPIRKTRFWCRSARVRGHRCPA